MSKPLLLHIFLLVSPLCTTSRGDRHYKTSRKGGMWGGREVMGLGVVVAVGQFSNELTPLTL